MQNIYTRFDVETVWIDHLSINAFSIFENSESKIFSTKHIYAAQNTPVEAIFEH